jgi:hypothetical protein
MPEASQYMFKHKELVAMMIKEAGLHEGKWALAINFGFAAINAGPGPDQMNPTAVAGVQAIGLQKAADDSPPALVVDAAEVNPRPLLKKN